MFKNNFHLILQIENILMLNIYVNKIYYHFELLDC